MGRYFLHILLHQLWITFFITSNVYLTFLHLTNYEGAIELSILADYYGREIAAYDIQTTRCDLYGQVSIHNHVKFPFFFFFVNIPYLNYCSTGKEV